MSNFNPAISRMEAQLRSHLESLRVKKGEPFTHTTKSPAASYYIGEDEIENFMTLYSNAISKGVRPTVTEKPGHVGPLRFDFDLKSSLDDGLKRKYTEDILTSIIGFIQEEIKNSIPSDTPNINFILRCVVLEKKGPRVEEGRIKDGFHFQFPNFVCEGWFQDEYLRNKITEKMITSKIWDGIKFLDPVEKFIDTGMAKKQWLMYGSAKAEGAEPFLLTKCYGPADIKTGKLVKISTADMFSAEMEGRKSRPEYYLPRFMSITGYLEATPLKQDIDARRAAYRTKKTQRGVIVRKRRIEDVMEDVKTIKEGGIMEMLSDDRADDYNSWLDVGWTLFNVGQGCDELLQLWIDFSRRSAKFVEGDCEDRWAKMEMRDKTIGSLFAMARSDNPDAYKSWKDMNIKTHIDRSLYEDKPNEWDVAQVVLKLYKDRFLCADAKKDVWYEFIGHRWQFMDDNVGLRLLLATEVVNLYYVHKSDIAAQQIKEQNETERAKLESKEAKCRKIITALKECNFQEKLIKMCKVVFHDPLFLKRIDENKLLFVCENGVLDFELMGFRDGRPDDYCTLSCNVIYPKNATHKDDECIEVEDYLKKVFPNPKLRQYFKDTASSSMEGGNVNKTFIVGTGIGDNAKTVTYAFIEMTFGEYCIKFPRELFVIGKGNSSGSARPELARVRGKRLAIVSEIAKTETLNIGILKELTGNDSFFTRGIYEKGTEIRPMFTLMMQCLRYSTPIPVPGGFSMPLGELSDNTKVLAWDSETKGIRPATQKKFLRQGTKECIAVTLKDGSSIECTPEHRLLTSDGVYIEAKDIIPGETRLAMGVHQPYYNDLQIHTPYKFLSGTYNLNSMGGKLKAMTLCRLLGYGLADENSNVTLYSGHKLDSQLLVDEIFNITGKTPTIAKGKFCSSIHIPSELTSLLNKLCPAQNGGRMNNPMVVPEFIFDSGCPDYLVREVLAGMFGGDGVVPSVDISGKNGKRVFSPMRYIVSKINKYIPSLIEQFHRIVDLLQTRFGIESYIEAPLEYEVGKRRVQIIINKEKDVKSFIEKIGVRYCFHKAYRLTAVLSYYRYKDSITNQNEDLLLDYMKETGLDIFCNDSNEIKTNHFDATTLPTYKMLVVGREDSGAHEVFDLTIEEPYSNYMSNGMISHNCNEPPKVPGHDDATWNRIRVLDYESKFVKLVDLDKYPVPESIEEQFKMKRFMADNTFMRKLPELCPYLLWILFENYKIYKKNGLVEPTEVRASTTSYRQQNDVYIQYVGERIVMASKEDMQSDEIKEKFFLKLADLHTDFTTWYHENHSSYAKEKFNKITLKHEFSKRFPGAFATKGRTQGWYGYSIIPDEENGGTFGAIPAAKNANDIKKILASKGKSKVSGKPESKTPIAGTKIINLSPRVIENKNGPSKAKVSKVSSAPVRPKTKSINLIEDMPVPKSGVKRTNAAVPKSKVIKTEI